MPFRISCLVCVPVWPGLVAGLSRPGFNVTGVTMLAGPPGTKRPQLLRELVPQATAVGLLVNPKNTNSEIESADLQTGGRSMGLRMARRGPARASAP